MKMKVKNFKICVLIVCMMILIANVYGATTTPTLVTKINSAFNKIQDYLIKISVPIAGVAIASGVLIRKFSFGDEEKLRIGKKMIVNAIVGYGIILSIDLIIKFVDALI